MIATVLDPAERAHVDAIGSGCFATMHGDSVRDAVRTVRERGANALLLSVRCLGHETPGVMEQFARTFPAVSTVALLTRHDPADAEALLRLGATGVRHVVDATQPSGWRQLREVLAPRPLEHNHAILRAVLVELAVLTPGGRHFWDVLVDTAPRTTTIRRLTTRLGVTPSTFMSRFHRAGLPSPKNHLVGARICHAALFFDAADLTISDVAYRLDYASPQSFGRHLRMMLGITPTEFRSRYPFTVVVERFIDRLVRPYRETWKAFHPLAPGRE